MQENEIQAIVAGQRQFFFGGKTLPLDYRIQALKRLKQAIVGNQKKIADALQQDLGKSEAEGFMCETGLVLSEISYMLRHIRRFAREKTVYTPLSQFGRGQPHPADTLRCHVDYESLELSLPAYGRTTGGCAGRPAIPLWSSRVLIRRRQVLWWKSSFHRFFRPNMWRW